jgi:hypothetical protein
VLHVRKAAEVTIDDRPTKATGSRRVYVSHLEPGARYRFRVRVAEGAVVARHDVILQAGQTKTLELQGDQLAAK